MSKSIKKLLSELKKNLKAIYGDRLKAFYLFGSYARGEEDQESDLDVAVVLDDFDRYGAEVDRTSSITSQLSLDYGVSISKVFLRKQDWIKSETPFLVNIKEEAIPA